MVAQFCSCFRINRIGAAEFQSKVNAPGSMLCSSSHDDGPTRVVLNQGALMFRCLRLWLIDGTDSILDIDGNLQLCPGDAI